MRFAGRFQFPRGGNVEAYVNDQWMPICDRRNISTPEGRVICRQLGFTGVVRPFYNSFFGTPTIPPDEMIINLNCNGQEYSLDQCDFTVATVGSSHAEGCSQNSIFGVICLGNQFI